MRNPLSNLRHFGPAWPVDAALPGPGGSGVELRPWASNLLLVRLWGGFAQGWAGTLSLGLSGAGVAIVRGFARQIGPGRWVAELQVRAAEPHRSAAAIDYLGLATGPAVPAAPVPIDLHGYYADQSPDVGGSLFLEVRGEDRVGFLGSLLDRLAGLGLFPEELAIETQGQVALDRLALRAAGGALPSDLARRSLVATLDRLVRREAHAFAAVAAVAAP